MKSTEWECPLLFQLDILLLVPSTCIISAVSIVHECSSDCKFIPSTTTSKVFWAWKYSVASSVFTHVYSYHLFVLGIQYWRNIFASSIHLAILLQVYIYFGFKYIIMCRSLSTIQSMGLASISHDRTSQFIHVWDGCVQSSDNKPVAVRIHVNNLVRYSFLRFAVLNSIDWPVSYSLYAFCVRVCALCGTVSKQECPT